MNRITNVRTYAAKVARLFGYAVYWNCVAHCVLEYIGDFVICVGPSMEPTIYSENVVFTEHLSAHRQKIKRGDIVITKSPCNPKHYICKRVIGIPGDKVCHKFFSSYVPKGHVWLEGDNKYNSSDSRNYGPVPQGLIKGRVVCRIWPLDNIKMLTRPTKTSY
ncbi:mitochondrial inner membrane protease subunit, putative [Pediculus humanus corporis]|uniref:Mitochondrial inner membrane protease subunit n=1 Tax=Pediculus humanus subsp. corporis TaxID=121224 RepID=E0W2B0_PEDHC|nr:mitochondrial inner membrane protease subunit, putative [Pediculus humanus corporis]EEB19766.1 mitochondrial inner membrane protease subunit, putative [Pediculus humanus corporis]